MIPYSIDNSAIFVIITWFWWGVNWCKAYKVRKFISNSLNWYFQQILSIQSTNKPIQSLFKPKFKMGHRNYSTYRQKSQINTHRHRFQCMFDRMIWCIRHEFDLQCPMKLISNATIAPMSRQHKKVLKSFYVQLLHSSFTAIWDSSLLLLVSPFYFAVATIMRLGNLQKCPLTKWKYEQNLNRLRTNKSLKLKNKICFEFGRRHFRFGMNFNV